MKIGEKGTECYEQSACKNTDNQDMADQLDYVIGVLSVCQNRLLAARIRIQKDENAVMRDALGTDIHNELAGVQEITDIALKRIRNVTDAIRKQTGAVRDPDPSEYCRT